MKTIPRAAAKKPYRHAALATGSNGAYLQPLRGDVLLHPSPCVKVVFPLPRGNATVVLKPGLDDEGRFTLLSSGSGFSDAGFYRVVETEPEHLKVLRLATLREHFVVYTDERGELRCDHTVRFLGIMILKLHYRMRRKP